MEAKAILQMLERVQKSGAYTTTTETLDAYDLGGIHCEKCNDSGAIVTRAADGTIYARECECMNKRRAIRRIRQSGMSDLLTRCTFDSYEAVGGERERLKAKAQHYAAESSGWFYIAGRSGSGKTHICTAICSELISGGTDVYYMRWRDEARELKASVNDTERHEAKLQKLKRVAVLYIDDFLKGGVTDADVRLAFEIINSRYNDVKLRTIISSEIDMAKLLSIDEALAGRIYERSKGNVLKAPDENWRLR